jgi:hypothetical protein
MIEYYENSEVLFARKIYEENFVVEVPVIFNDDGSKNEEEIRVQLDECYRVGVISRDAYLKYA